MDASSRIAKYLAQTGRADLTPRQLRRVGQKARHQMPEAAARRELMAKEKAARREERAKAHLSSAVNAAT